MPATTTPSTRRNIDATIATRSVSEMAKDLGETCAAPGPAGSWVFSDQEVNKRPSPGSESTIAEYRSYTRLRCKTKPDPNFRLQETQLTFDIFKDGNGTWEQRIEGEPSIANKQCA